MNVAEGLNSLKSVFKGAVSTAAGLGSSVMPLAGTSFSAAKAIGSDVMTNKLSSQLFKHVALGSFLGAGVGLGATAIGRGADTTLPGVGVQHDSMTTSLFKGAVVGAGVATGIGALFHARGTFAAASSKFANNGLMSLPPNMIGKTLGNRFGVGMLAGGAAIGGSGMLLNSIISTSMTKAQGVNTNY